MAEISVTTGWLDMLRKHATSVGVTLTKALETGDLSDLDGALVMIQNMENYMLDKLAEAEDVEKIKKEPTILDELWKMAGIHGPDDPYAKSIGARALQFSPKHLHEYSTACGDVPNQPFSKRMCKKLVDEGAEAAAIFADGERGESIQALALKCSEKRAKSVEISVERLGGSLRLEDEPVDGWWLFESE
jgi:hypothetical protein